MTNPIKYIDVESRPVKWLVDGLKVENIIVDNSFQRRYVWMLKDRIALIETILLGYPIPEVYLWQNETNPETGDTIHSIVDGQQRLGAVHTFINDEYKLAKSGLEFKDNDYAGKVFSELTPDQKSIIWKYPFSIRFIEESLPKEKIVELFLRLNRTNVTLNPQELRNAEFSGLFIKLAEDISKEEFWSKYDIFNAADYRRMIDIQFISTLLLFIRSGIEEETTQSAINRVYDQYNENYPESDNDKEVLLSTLDTLKTVLEGSGKLAEIIKRKTHFYTIFIYAYYLKKKSFSDKLTEVGNKLNIWYDKYLSNTSLGDEKYDKLLDEYKILSQEGVQKRVNRQRRFEIIKEYVGL